MRYVIAIVCCYTHVLFAQEGFRTVNFYTTQNGLSDNSINCIWQDSRGFLWLGTKEGLNRFDGSRFKKFFAAKDPAVGLSNNTVLDILEYRYCQLLIATSSGLSVFNTLSNSFENEKIKRPELKGGSGTLINSLYKDKSGNIWINHSGELDMLDSNLQYLKRFTNEPWAKSLKGIIVGSDNWFTDKQNRLWLAGDTSGIHLIDLSHKKIWNKQNNPKQYDFLKPSYIRSVLPDEASNTLWYAPWDSGVYRFDMNSNTQQKQDFGLGTGQEFQSVNKIMKISDEKILCMSAPGCFIVDIATLKYEQAPIEVPGSQESEISLVSLLKATNGNYWIGTSGGLFQLEDEDIISPRLDLTKNGKKVPWEECNSILRSLAGDLYITNLSHALLEVKKDLKDFSNYPIDNKKAIVCISQDKKGQLWVGSSIGLYQFNAVTKKFTQPAWLHPDLYKARINFIYCDAKEDIWIATRQSFGLYKYSAQTGTCEKINNSVTAYFEKLGSSSRISRITENKNHIWMISRLGGGIICYNKKSGEWDIYPKKENHRNLLSKGLNFIYADEKNNLWLSELYGTGLIKYNYANDSINLITRNDGLPSDFIKSLSYDGGNNLWILTEYGISRFDLATEKIIFNSFFKSKTTYPIELLTFDEASKTLIAASNNLLSFHPVEKFMPDKKETLHPLIDKVWVNSKEVNEDVNGQSLKLRPGQTNISIDFTAIHYSNADKIRFAYKLSGADHDWKYADASRSAQYAVLAPGTYSFTIKVADENGNWGEPFDTFSFTIVPWFWQTAWFKIAVVLLLVAACWLMVRRRIKNIRHAAELKQKMTETEMMALRAQMNPHFIFNCISAIDNLIQSDRKEKATVYLTRFAKLIRSVLDNSKNNLVPFYKDYESLQLFLQLEKFRCNDKFEYRLNADEEILNSDIKVPPLIIQPFVENAIHHGLMNKTEPDRELNIRVQIEKDYLKYTITDNGVGREIAEALQQINKPEHVSYGLDISSKRVNLHNKYNGVHPGVVITDLKKENVPVGTKVELWLSLK